MQMMRGLVFGAVSVIPALFAGLFAYILMGGETEFPELDLTVKPKKGMAVTWRDLHRDGSINYSTAHTAHPVRKGRKI
ncbi:MAG: hypothetical protein QF566_05745, partial [Candidatus Thalassarchaeaceae archaeon]|nr:hypothetical protein [Candidatus Thalassarchaeaceae archaeon]